MGGNIYFLNLNRVASVTGFTTRNRETFWEKSGIYLRRKEANKEPAKEISVKP